jgi:hypothetical protein
MELIILILLLVAGFLCFLADALTPVQWPRPRLTALGLAFWIVAYAIQTLPI